MLRFYFFIKYIKKTNNVITNVLNKQLNYILVEKQINT